MKSARFHFFTILLSVVAVCTHAQENVCFTVNAPETVAAGEIFHIAYTLNDDVESDAAPYLSNTQDFVVLMGPALSRSLSASQVNGVQTRTATTTYTYTFQVNGAGDYTIPYCSLKTKKRTYRSNQLTIKVLPNGDEKPGSATMPTNANSKPAVNSGDADMFVQVELSHTSVSTNDSLTATVKFYSQQDFISIGKMIFPTFEGFTVQEISLPEIRQATKERYKGKNYHTVILRQYKLHPKQAGQQTITSGSYDIIVPQKKQNSSDPRDLFDTPTQSVEMVTLVSQGVTLTVHPSPDDASTTSANVDDITETHHDSVKTADNDLAVEKTATENEISKQKLTDNKTRTVLLYSSVILLVLLLVVYISKLSATRQHMVQEQDSETTTKPSFTWHLPFITGIILLICCIAALW